MILVTVDYIVNVVNRHTGHEVHAALPCQVNADKQAERTAAESARCMVKAVNHPVLHRRMVMLPCARNRNQAGDEKQKSEDNAAAQIYARLCCIRDEECRNHAANHGPKRGPDHPDIGESGSGVIVVHHIRKQTIVRHHQDS